MGIFGLGNKKETSEKKDQKKDISKEESSINIKDKIEAGYIHFRAIIEMLGKPKEYIDETLHNYVAKLDENKELTVIKKDFAEPKAEKELFSVFVEIELLAKSMYAMVGFCIDYMPSSIEIIEPERMMMRSQELSNFFNDLQIKLHHLDMIAKNLNAENINLRTNAGALLRNLIMQGLVLKSMTLKELTNYVGIPEEQLKPFVEARVNEGFVEKKGERYSATIRPEPKKEKAKEKADKQKPQKHKKGKK